MAFQIRRDGKTVATLLDDGTVITGKGAETSLNTKEVASFDQFKVFRIYSSMVPLPEGNEEAHAP